MSYKINQVIECLQNLLECDGSWDVHLNSQIRGNASRWNGHNGLIWVAVHGGYKVQMNLFPFCVHTTSLHQLCDAR